MLNVEAVIHVTMEALWAVKPLAGADEDTARKPLRAIVAIGCAVEGGNIVVAVGAIGRNADVNCYLSACVCRRRWITSRRGKADLESSSKCKKSGFVHTSSSLGAEMWRKTQRMPAQTSKSFSATGYAL